MALITLSVLPAGILGILPVQEEIHDIGYYFNSIHLTLEMGDRIRVFKQLLSVSNNILHWI